jgi:hypothetical protein
MALSKVNPNFVSQLGRRNLVINGGMLVAQRGTTATGTGAGSAYSTVDRWRNQKSASPLARFTETQSADYDAPTGHSKSLKLQVTTANGTIPANSFQYIDQFVESQNLSHLNWHTASSGEPLVLSFWVKCSTAQVFAIDFVAYSATQKYLTKNYTVNSANTWEKKTITIPADASNVIAVDNSRGIRLRWALTAGSDRTGSGGVDTTWQTSAALEFSGHVNTWADSVGGTWQLAGVQLEVGTVATEFEHRSYAEELAACQRYYEQTGAGAPAKANSSTEFWIGHKFSVTKRANPTASIIDPNSYVRVYEFGVADRNSDSTPTISAIIANVNGASTRVGTFSSISAGDTGMLGGKDGDSGASTFAFDAEL